MGIEPPPNIMKAGERPARVRTGAKTATKNQERDYLEKFRYLSQHPEVLVPEWIGPGTSPFARLSRKLDRVKRIQGSERRLRWSSRGKKLWHAYAATLLVERIGKIQSFASLKFQGHDVKFVYRPGAKRESLIGVQHYDEPEARLLGYIPFARKRRVYLVSSSRSFVALRSGTRAPDAALREALGEADVSLEQGSEGLHCAHMAPASHGVRFTVEDIGWRLELCSDCLRRLPKTVSACLDSRVLGPKAKVDVKRTPLGGPFQLRSPADEPELRVLLEESHRRAEQEADEKYASYTEAELLQWTREELLRSLEKRDQGFLLVGDDLWLSDYGAAAETLGTTDLERRALRHAFREKPPRQRAGDTGLHRLLEPVWASAGPAILLELSDGLLRESELAEVGRLPPTEALSALARLLAARERFREILQFEALHPSLEFVVDCVQIQRSGERALLSGKLQAASRADATRVLALSVARAIGEGPLLDWQYAPHEKDAAAFLDPFVRELVEASPPQFATQLARLAQVIGVPPPALKAARPA